MALPETFEVEVVEAVEAAFVEPEKGDEDTVTNQEEESNDANKKNKADAGEAEQSKSDDESADSEIHPGDLSSKASEDSDGSGSAKDSEVDAIPAVSEAALAQAISAGFSVEDALSFPSDESLLRVVGAVQNHAAKVADSKQETEEKDNQLDLPKLNPDDYEPEVVQMFDKLTDVIRQQQENIDEFRTQQQAATQSSQETNARDVEQWFDKQVNGLGDEFAEALGAGGYGDQPQGSSQLAKRDEIATQMAVMFAGYSASGISPPPRETVFKTASQNVLRDEYAKVSEKAIADRLAKRSTQHIQRAGGTKVTSTQTPAEETAQLLDEKFPSK